MGENVLQNQVEKFKKGRDKAVGKLSQPTLFPRPEVFTTTFTAEPMPEKGVFEGDDLHAYHLAGEHDVLLVKGHEVVGVVRGDGAEVLQETLDEPGSPGLLPMRVTNVSPLSGFITAVVTGNESENGK